VNSKPKKSPNEKDKNEKEKRSKYRSLKNMKNTILNFFSGV